MIKEIKKTCAFPVVNSDNLFDPGMTLRDYFAAKAMLKARKQ